MKNELINALIKLNKAFQDVNDVVLDYKFTHDDELIDNYPFELSFDEQTVAVDEWINSVIEQLRGE